MKDRGEEPTQPFNQIIWYGTSLVIDIIKLGSTRVRGHDKITSKQR